MYGTEHMMKQVRVCKYVFKVRFNSKFFKDF